MLGGRISGVYYWGFRWAWEGGKGKKLKEEIDVGDLGMIGAFEMRIHSLVTCLDLQLLEHCPTLNFRWGLQ